MASILRPGEPERGEICVETRQGTPIDNRQDWDDLPPYYQYTVRKLETDFPPPGAIHGDVASPVYNCHGLTFASRRTCIFEATDIARIIEEDDYGEVAPKNVRLGDIVVYYLRGDASHSGIVIEIPADLPVRILSKWGRGKEVNHWVNVGPYKYDIIKYFRVTR